jgi:molybdopterin/thiamine biosynthesis adenylyltransferase/proteasome lid subunit RPN8/RPN11
MGVIRMAETVYSKTRDHLFSKPGEHFAFLRARTTESAGKPVFLVHDTVLVPDSRVRVREASYEIDPEILLETLNAAVRSGDALIEVHNHGRALPRPSKTDRDQLAEFVPYILDSLPDRPYAATIWSETSIYGEYFAPSGATGVVRSITASGIRLRQLVSRDDDLNTPPMRFDRQLPWFTAEGQRQLARLRVAVVGAGGTGSPTLVELVYLGARDLVGIDHDQIDETSLNRTISATPADIETQKVIAARRVIKSVAPDARMRALAVDLRTNEALDALKGADAIFGCVDNDGARLILNELAVAYEIPYFDLGVGIEVEGGMVSEIGGRVAAVIPGGPCLLCMDLIDRSEARYFLASDEEQADQRRRGYVRGLDEPAPSVVSLNGTIASLAVTEFGIYLSGLRMAQPLTVLDVLGKSRITRAQWVVPERVKQRSSCFRCAHAGIGDTTTIERFAA